MSRTGLGIPWPLAAETTSKSPRRIASSQGPVGAIRCVTLTPIFLPFIDQPSADIFIGLVDVAVQQLEAEPLGAGLFQQPFCFGARLLDVLLVPARVLFKGRLALTSAAVSGVPSWNLTPLRSSKT